MFAARLRELRRCAEVRDPSRFRSSGSSSGVHIELERPLGPVDSSSLRSRVPGVKHTPEDSDDDSVVEGERGVAMPKGSGDELSGSEDEQLNAMQNFAIRRLFRQPSEPTFMLPKGFESCSWWATCIRNAVATRWDSFAAKFKVRDCPMQLEGFCAGLGTEFMTCDALGIPIARDCITSEIKAPCQRFLAENMFYKHVFQNMASQSEKAAYCEKHCTICPTSVGLGRRIDLLLGGTPCQPFSRLATGKCIDHPLYNVTFGEANRHGDPTDSVMHLIKVLLPSAVLLEQVAGFGSFHECLDDRAVTKFIEQLLAIRDASGKEHFVAARIFKLNSNVWVNMSRPRSP